MDYGQPPWMEIAWNGIRFMAPADWQVGTIGKHYLMLEEDSRPVLEFKWGQVKGAFSHRRKTLLNSLKYHCLSLDNEMLLHRIKKCGIDPGTRAETLGIDAFVRLASAIDIDKPADILIDFV